MGDGRKRPGTIRAMNEQDLRRNRQRTVLFEDAEGFGGIAHHHAHHDMIHRVAGGDSMDIDLGVAENVTHSSQGPRPVLQEKGELTNDLNSSNG